MKYKIIKVEIYGLNVYVSETLDINRFHIYANIKMYISPNANDLNREVYYRKPRMLSYLRKN